MSAEGQPTPPSGFRFCGCLTPGRVRKSHNPGQTGSAPSSNRPRVATGKAKPVSGANSKPSTGAGRLRPPSPALGNQGLLQPAERRLVGVRAFQKEPCPGGRWEPLGRRPQLPSGWERRPPPGARLALKTWPVGPKWLGPRWLHTQHPVCPAEGLTFSESGDHPSLSADRELSGPSPRPPLLPGSAEQGTAASTGRLSPQRSLLLTCPDRFCTWRRRVGGHSLPPAWRPGWRVQHRPRARDPPGLRVDTGEALAPVTPNTCQPGTQARSRPGLPHQPRCGETRRAATPLGRPAPPPSAAAPHKGEA